MVEQGPIQVTYTKSGLQRFKIEIAHRGLSKYQVIRAKERHICRQKAAAKIGQWEKQWERKQERERKLQRQAANQERAEERTEEAQAELERLRNILAATLDVDDAVDWSTLKDHSSYSEPKPEKPPLDLPPEPETPKMAPEPKENDPAYQPKLGLLGRLWPPRARQKREEAKERFQRDLAAWKKERRRLASEYKSALEAHKETCRQKEDERERVYTQRLAEWEEARDTFLEEQKETNAQVDALRQAYELKDPEAVYEYCDLVLAASEYPDYFPQTYELDYNPENQLLVVDYQLPNREALPTVEKVTYVKSRDEFKEKELAQSKQRKLYDSVLYQVALRTVHELFEADVVDALGSVVFNGYVRSIDPATGNERNPCVMSLQTSKGEFLEINLANVDPKACFKKLNGVGSARLHKVTPVAPIVKIERDESRFVDSYDVAEKVEGENLAAMDWEDFEHLIRELFEKEFSEDGSEVKVTQASRDGGIDAVIFDPDPLRGGKIVVQAKRYTNTVGLSAVRDLYGTVMNEGANKGILVTTSDYGPDAYAFARNKPISLLNGGNLVHLLQKHGHDARIDIDEARKLR